MLKPYQNKNLRKYFFCTCILWTNVVIYRLRLDSTQRTLIRVGWDHLIMVSFFFFF